MSRTILFMSYLTSIIICFNLNLPRDIDTSSIKVINKIKKALEKQEIPAYPRDKKMKILKEFNGLLYIETGNGKFWYPKKRIDTSETFMKAYMLFFNKKNSLFEYCSDSIKSKYLESGNEKNILYFF